jgi:hypothetical protein
MARRSRLVKPSTGKWRRRLAYASGAASLAALPYTVYNPILGTAIVFGGGMGAVVGAYGAKTPADKYAGVTTMKELRKRAHEYREEMKRGKKKG